jgi:hypothetical protein
MDYRDVTNVEFKSTRTVNPLDPTYVVRDEDSKVTQIGLIPGNKPVVLPPARKDENFQKTSLQTHDIHGCATSTRGLGSFHTRERRGWRDTNTTADIVGAQPNTLKKSPDTIRCTNPLNPDYQMPGRHDCTDPSDAFSKRKTPIQAAAQAALGITEGSKLYSASRKGSEAEARSVKSNAIAAASEKSVKSNAIAAASDKSMRSNAQKLDKFI